MGLLKKLALCDLTVKQRAVSYFKRAYIHTRLRAPHVLVIVMNSFSKKASVIARVSEDARTCALMKEVQTIMILKVFKLHRITNNSTHLKRRCWKFHLLIFFKSELRIKSSFQKSCSTHDVFGILAKSRVIKCMLFIEYRNAWSDDEISFPFMK